MSTEYADLLVAAAEKVLVNEQKIRRTLTLNNPFVVDNQLHMFPETPLETTIETTIETKEPILETTNKVCASLKDLGIELFYICNPQRLSHSLSHLLSHSPTLGLDIETYGLPEFKGDKQAGLEPRKSAIRTIQIFDGKTNVYVFDLLKLGGLDCLGKDIWECPMIAHNALFELKHLLHKGAYPKKLGCTLLADRILNGDRRELKEDLGLSRSAGLKDLAKELLGLDISKEQQTSDWSQENLTQEQLEYAALDAVLTFKLFEIQRALLTKKGLTRPYQILRDAQYSVAKMELSGIGFDIQKHKALMLTWREESERLEADIFDVIGRELNINSSKQMGEWLRDVLKETDLEAWTKTGSGALSTSTPTFKLNAHTHAVIPKIVEYRHVTKRLSAFGDSLYKFIDVSSNRLYGSFSLGMTATGRMSSYNPNMQNMPRDDFRDLFCAQDGYCLIGLDYSQQELRVAAFITQDKELLRIYQEGGDVHTNTAASILKIPREQVGKSHRQLAKAVIFGLLYGQGAKGLSIYAKRQYSVDMAEEEAQKHREGLFNTYKGLRKWQISTGKLVEITQKIKTPCGRERDFSRERLGYRYNAALNLPIQGAAAEITLHAIRRLASLICDDCRLVNVIHDEILLEVREDKAHIYAENAKEAMEHAFLDVFPNAGPYMKGLVEAKLGKTWAETK
ncbi:DNA polymerase [Candidatus Protochlamydia phocaeensis]|uniref:DNA polymerase n=1 Tax=Candidatus Protochlamydia phocaeensis TaxID=1414722 RepID=UPI000839344D|nr:DNA polymerase [Candidatus Protochlamydia phocaeensis]